MKSVVKKIILASNSPRRKELLAGLGMPFEVKVLKDIDETAGKTGRTRTEFMLMSLEFALDHLEIEER